MKLTLFCVSTTPGLLHDVFQEVSVHPIPIEICYGLLRYALTLLFCGFGRWYVSSSLFLLEFPETLTPFLLLIYLWIYYSLISATRLMKLTLLVSLFWCLHYSCGLLHDVFQLVSVHTIPIEICYGMLSDAFA